MTAPYNAVRVFFVLVVLITFIDDVEVGDMMKNASVVEERFIIAWAFKTI